MGKLLYIYQPNEDLTLDFDINMTCLDERFRQIRIDEYLKGLDKWVVGITDNDTDKTRYYIGSNTHDECKLLCEELLKKDIVKRGTDEGSDGCFVYLTRIQ